MPKTAAMVPAQVVLAGGAGLTDDVRAACEQIFQQFDPPIVFGTYSQVSSARQAANNEQGASSPFQNQQSEHGVANSAFQSDRGNNASNIPTAPGYSEGQAPAFNVFDGQSAGTEHKWLTDAAKDFHEELQAAGKQGSVTDHLDRAEQNWQKCFEEKLKRRKGEQPRERLKDTPKKRSDKEKKDLNAAAARCLRLMHEAQFAKMKVDLGTKLRNGLSNVVKEATKKAKAAGGGAC